MRIKQFIKQILPIRFEPGVRQIFYFLRGLQYWGGRHYCPCCGWRIRRFLPGGVTPRPHAQCPRCGSLERHRLLFLYLKLKTDFFSRKLHILDIAPTYFMQQKFRHFRNLNYLSTSLDDPWAISKIDITVIPMPESSFDCIICYHVLEHIVHDQQAMKELFRVLKPDGWAILQSPVDMARETTLEESGATTPEERRILFGQEDHVRMYGRDFIERIRESGFHVTAEPFAQQFSETLIDQYGLVKDEVLYICRKQFIS